MEVCLCVSMGRAWVQGNQVGVWLCRIFYPRVRKLNCILNVVGNILRGEGRKEVEKATLQADQRYRKEENEHLRVYIWVFLLLSDWFWGKPGCSHRLDFWEDGLLDFFSCIFITVVSFQTWMWNHQVKLYSEEVQSYSSSSQTLILLVCEVLHTESLLPLFTIPSLWAWLGAPCTVLGMLLGKGSPYSMGTPGETGKKQGFWNSMKGALVGISQNLHKKLQESVWRGAGWDGVLEKTTSCGRWCRLWLI